jgi:hypothetical protein
MLGLFLSTALPGAAARVRVSLRPFQFVPKVHLRGDAMSKGLGALQREIKQIIDLYSAAVRWSDIREILAIEHAMTPALSRSARRALKSLVDSGDVVIVRGRGGQLDPLKYTTVERLTSESDTARAKAVWAEMCEQVQALKSRLG